MSGLQNFEIDEVFVTQYMEEEIPKRRKLYLGIFQTKDKALGSTLQPVDNKQYCINALIAATKHGYDWRKILIIEADYD